MIEDRSSILSRILFSVAFLLFGLRFLWPGDTVYILDEAYQQIRIDEHFAAGTIPFSNARGSSIPVPYGPGALWIFMIIRLFTWHPVSIAIYHLCIQAFGALLFVHTIRRAYGSEASAWCALLVASSPLLFFFARHPWDPDLLIPMAAILLYLLQKLREDSAELPTHLALGFVAGYGVNTHLMFGPVAIATGLTLMQMNWKRYGFRSPRFWGFLLAFGGAALLILAPYLVEALRISNQEAPFANARNKEHWGDGRNLWWLFQRTALYSSLFGSNIQLHDVREEFYRFSGSFWTFFFAKDFFGWFGKLAAWISAIVVAVQLLRGRFEADPLRFFAASAFFATLLVYQYLNIPTDPHYFNPLWWFVFVGIAGAIVRLHGLWKHFFLVTLACSALVNSAYVIYATAYIHENKGARNMATSVVVSEQLRMFRELCASGKPEVRVFKDAFLADPGFDFLPRHMPECKTVKITLVASIDQADFHLRHPRDSTTSAALVLEPNQLPTPPASR